MPTARDVARLAGASVAVVSYVFNNGPRPVSAATRARVLAAAKELDYHPNMLARALKAGRTRSIGLIVPDIANPYFAELARVIEDVAAEGDNLLLIADSALSAQQEERHRRSLIERQVDSVVLVSVTDAPELDSFDQAGIRVVSLQPVVEGTAASALTIDFEEAAATATSHLVSHGYHDLRILLGPTDGVGLLEHRRGFDRVVRAAGATGGVWRSAISRYDASRVAVDLLRAGDRPRAVYCTTDEQALGVLHAAFVVGLRVPADLAVIGVDGTRQAEVSVPPLTTVQQPLRAYARRALQLLSDGAEPHRERLPFSFVVRESCGLHA